MVVKGTEVVCRVSSSSPGGKTKASTKRLSPKASGPQISARNTPRLKDAECNPYLQALQQQQPQQQPRARKDSWALVAASGERFDNEVLQQRYRRKDAEYSVKLLQNRIALLAGEEERSKRKIELMQMAIERVAQCKREQADRSRQSREIREGLAEERLERTRKLREEARRRKGKIERQRRQELDEKKKTVTSFRRQSQDIISQVRHIRQGEESVLAKHDNVVSQRQRTKKKKEMSKKLQLQLMEEKKQSRLEAEMKRRNAAESKLMNMANNEKKMLERLLRVRKKQQETYSIYERLYKP